MEINIQLFGGRGTSSGGNFRGSTKPPRTNPANSTYTWYRNGKPYQKRWYVKFGNPKMDKDYTDHGNNKKHPETPTTMIITMGNMVKGTGTITMGRSIILIKGKKYEVYFRLG